MKNGHILLKHCTLLISWTEEAEEVGKAPLDRWGKAGSVLHQMSPSKGRCHLCLRQCYTPSAKLSPGAGTSVTIVN